MVKVILTPEAFAAFKSDEMVVICEPSGKGITVLAMNLPTTLLEGEVPPITGEEREVVRNWIEGTEKGRTLKEIMADLETL